jgi:hypothetical protein
MRRKYIKKGGQKTPADIVNMGLDKEYQQFVAYCIEREKTHEVIWVKNPPHYKSKAYRVDIWRKTEDLFCIYAETMFGKKEVFEKENLINYR